MDIEKLTKETILKNMSPEQQKAVLESVMASVQESKKARSVKIAENVDLVMQALKKIEAQMLAKVSKATDMAETAAKNVKDGKDGRDGKDGKDGKQGAIGPKGADGRDGKNGKDGKDGRDGINGVSVVNAFLDFDNSLVIELSDGKQINVGGILADDTAEKVRVVANGGGTSQGVLDALAALQTEIDNLIPSQTGNAGKFLSTNGTNLSWVGGGGGLSYEGTWNASTNSPTLTSGVGTNGYYYVVSTTGTTNLDGITSWTVGDWAIFNGTNWQKIDNTDLVTSVAGRTGDVTLTNSDVSGSAASGANSDITSLSGLTGAISNPTYIQMGSGSGTTLAAGRIWYDQTTGSINAGMGGGNITQQIGEELFIYGKASSSITEGQLVVKTGAVGASGVITFAPSPTGLTDNDGIIGVATENITSGNFGRITTFGVVHGITTTGASVGETWADGDVLYYNPSYAGGMTKVKPSAPYAKFQVGIVTHAGSGGSGSIQVNLIPGSVLGGTDSNVQTNGLANGNLLTYNGTGSYWKNTALTAGTGISVSAASDGALTVTNSAPDQTVSLTAGTGISTSGTYPNFTITNSSPDQTVSLTGSGTTSISGTYPNFTISSSDAYTGTVTSVGGTGTVSGLSLSGTVTSSGSLTLGGTLDLSNVTGNAIVSKGLYAKTAMDGTYTDGIVVDYTTGTGRISVGSSDGIALYNGGVANTQLAALDTKGNLQISGAFVTNSQTVAANYTVPSGSSSTSAGPITVNSGISVTVSSGSRWVIL